ncbi:microsomal signal peptidase [Clavulina sp. PMI_390]|nr:microsomal signal peptidase [Clavulina sp. PMI_390]
MEAQLRSYMEGKTDFNGQKLAEQIQQFTLIPITVTAFVAGFVTQSLRLTFGILGFGSLAIALITIPAWPIYNRTPPRWLPAIASTSADNASKRD